MLQYGVTKSWTRLSNWTTNRANGTSYYGNLEKQRSLQTGGNEGRLHGFPSAPQRVAWTWQKWLKEDSIPGGGTWEWGLMERICGGWKWSCLDARGHEAGWPHYNLFRHGHFLAHTWQSTWPFRRGQDLSRASEVWCLLLLSLPPGRKTTLLEGGGIWNDSRKVTIFLICCWELGLREGWGLRLHLNPRNLPLED